MIDQRSGAECALNPASRTVIDPAVGRVTTIQDGPTRVTQTYDDDGNLTQENRKGVRTDWTYDGEDRMLTEVQPDVVPQVRTTHAYGFDGLRRTMKKDSVLTTYVWDGADYLMDKS